MTRVQIPAYTDRWIKGDRYGEIVSVYRTIFKSTYNSKQAARARYLTTGPAGGGDPTIEMAHVKLDKSGKTVRVILADCEVL